MWWLHHGWESIFCSKAKCKCRQHPEESKKKFHDPKSTFDEGSFFPLFHTSLTLHPLQSFMNARFHHQRLFTSAIHKNYVLVIERSESALHAWKPLETICTAIHEKIVVWRKVSDEKRFFTAILLSRFFFEQIFEDFFKLSQNFLEKLLIFIF